MKGFPTLKSSWPWPWIGSYCTPLLINLYLHAKFLEIEETSCGRTDIRTGGHLRPTILGRLRSVNLKMITIIVFILILITAHKSWWFDTAVLVYVWSMQTQKTWKCVQDGNLRWRRITDKTNTVRTHQLTYTTCTKVLEISSHAISDLNNSAARVVRKNTYTIRCCSSCSFTGRWFTGQ